MAVSLVLLCTIFFILGIYTICDKLNDLHKDLKELHQITNYLRDIIRELNKITFKNHIP